MKIIPNTPMANVVTSLVGIMGLVTRGTSAAPLHAEDALAEPELLARAPAFVPPAFAERDALTSPTRSNIGWERAGICNLPASFRASLEKQLASLESYLQNRLPANVRQQVEAAIASLESELSACSSSPTTTAPGAPPPSAQ